MEKLYTNLEYVNELCKIFLEYPTYYAWGAFGAPANKKNKNRSKVPETVGPKNFLFDCSGFAYKALPWGWNANYNKVYGGAVYKKIPELETSDILSLCSDVSSDFTNIEPGEILYMKGHVGIYIGEGRCIECTSKWKNGVMITGVSNTDYPIKKDLNYRKWLKHGKLPFIIYNEESNASEPEYTYAGLGEGLIRIARRVGITLDEIKRLNPEIKGPVYLVKFRQKVRIK